MIRLFFLIHDLVRGGAERQLVQLVHALDKKRFSITVATFYDQGDFIAEVKKIEGVRFCCLQKKGRWDLRSAFRLWRELRRVRPQIVHGYLSQANELALLGKCVGAKAVWGLRASNLNFSDYYWGKVGARLYQVGAWLSRFADLIIVNSQTGRKDHIAEGYSGARMVVIYNGFDTDHWRPDAEAGQRMRAQWEVSSTERLIGIVGRFDPMKGYPTFLRAAALLLQERSDVRFVCVGRGPKPYEEELRSLGEQLGLGDRLIWPGEGRDMVAVHNAFDIATSASVHGEGFPNVVGEAMACGVPCIVTDFGDLPFIIGNKEQVVPVDQPEALAHAWSRILDLSPEARAVISTTQRDRIVTEFSVQKLAERTAEQFARLVA